MNRMCLFRRDRAAAAVMESSAISRRSPPWACAAVFPSLRYDIVTDILHLQPPSGWRSDAFGAAGQVVTPNVIELALLAGSELAVDEVGALQQGQQLLAAGVQALLKGGHSSGPRSTDVYVGPQPVRLDARRLARTWRPSGGRLRKPC
ncbi:bifunctional hydroxymethylpyrimidine kinase/phosphomethylpyrimidine kinase [Mesorhizobium sp. M0152]|uniref:bifunctional hydroxymethylpyrimidine kinase/phosphomethylpyrimidine kinase n=1 Tax=unclassified Mesorhizobium TaxID=325217 RepID=UPI00333A1EE2